MAGNKAIFDTAMKRAHDHAWANQWDRALKEYNRALAEYPGDRTVLRNRAQCLLRLRRWEEAEEAYSELTVSDPADLFALNRLAEIYLAQRQMERAFETYNRLADMYLKQGQIHEAIRALLDLSRAMPKEKALHERLLKLTQEVGDRRAQVGELLALLQLALEGGEGTEAEQYADAANALDPDNPEVRRAVYSVRRRNAEEGGTAAIGGPAGTATLPGTDLLRRIEPEPREAVEFAAKASKAQSKGDLQGALELYDQAVRAGAKQSVVFYSSGVLNYQLDRPALAIPFLERSLQDPEFTTSSHYMIGQCYSALKDFSSAVVSFERALGGIDPRKITQNEADELVELYTAAAEANLQEQNPGRAASLYTNLLQIFKERKWNHARLSELEKKADELYNQSIQSKLAGIGRGSAMLAQDRLQDRMLDEPTARMDEAGLEEPTRLIGPAPIDATQLMGSSMLNRRSTPQTSQIRDDTTRPQALPGNNGKHMDVEAPTTLMHELASAKKPGSNLRTITEYLRAADVNSAVLSGNSGEMTGNDKVPDATSMLPEPGTISSEGHTYHNLTNAALVDMEHTSIAVQQLMAEAEYAIGMNHWEPAIDSCMEAIGIQPGYLPVHVLLGDIYLRRGQAEGASDKYQTVLDTYVARREPVAAAEICRRLLQVNPSNPSLLNRLGLLLMEGGKIDEAAIALLAIPESLYKAGETQKALEEALNLKNEMPDSAEVALAVGTYLTALGRHQEALVELSRTLHLDPANNKALVRLYVLLTATNEQTQWDALQSILERAGKEKRHSRLFMEELYAAIKREPSPSLFYGLAVLAERASMTEISKDSIDQGLLQISMSDTSELKETWPLLDLLMSKTRADLAMTAKESAVAIQHYTRALDVLKTHDMLDKEKGKGSKGKKGEKGEKAKKGATLTSPRPQYSFLRLPEPSELYYGLAEAHAIESDWDGALHALEALKEWMQAGEGRMDHSVHTRLADIYFRQGNLAKALSELNDLLVFYQKTNENDKTLETLGHMAKLAPNNVAVRRKLSDLYIKLGMTEYGLEELGLLAELQLKAGLLKDAMASYQRAADLHFTMGQHDKAIAIYERIVRLAPRDIEARHQLANMYIQAGRITDAVECERAMADLFSNEGEADGAIAALHQLLALSPDDVPALHMLAQELVSIGEYGQAARLYGRLLRLEPENDRIPILHSEMQRMAKEAEQNAKTDPVLSSQVNATAARS